MSDVGGEFLVKKLRKERNVKVAEYLRGNGKLQTIFNLDYLT